MFYQQRLLSSLDMFVHSIPGNILVFIGLQEKDDEIVYPVWHTLAFFPRRCYSFVLIQSCFQMATSTEETTERLAEASIRKYGASTPNRSTRFHSEGAIVYTSEKHGDDKDGDGSEAKPFKTTLQVSHFLRWWTCHGALTIFVGLSKARRKCVDLHWFQRWNQSRSLQIVNTRPFGNVSPG